MKTYIADIIPQIQRFSQKLDNLTLLTNQHWVAIDEITEAKTVYIFRGSNELLIVVNGKVTKAKWEYLGNKSILIDNNSDSYLFKHGFFDENVLALKIDSKEEYAFLVNENKYGGEINSVEKVIDFLRSKYLFQSFDQIANPSVIEATNEVSPVGIESTEEPVQNENENFYKILFIGILIILAFLLTSQFFQKQTF
jgi:hypothetical protein